MGMTICAVWGPLHVDRNVHMDCPVVVHAAHEGCIGSPARTEPLPMVCACECATCKRAWWAQGRPVIRGGVIVSEPALKRPAPAP